MTKEELDDAALALNEAARLVLCEPQTQAEDYDRRYCNLKQFAREQFDFDRLIHEFAVARLEAEVYKALHDDTSQFDNQILSIALKKVAISKAVCDQLVALVRDYEKSRTAVFTQMFLSGVKTMELKASKRASKAAEVRHSKPGASRDKQDAIRMAWSTGKYSSRDICAEQECAGLNMSFSTARKALIGTPKPT